MIFRRTFRSVTASLAIFSLLFANLALAAYACPIDSPVMQANQQEAEQSGYVTQDFATANLCEAHCQDEQGQSSSATLPLLAFVAAYVTPIAVAAPAGVAPFPAAPLLSRTTSPPHAITHCCWRI